MIIKKKWQQAKNRGSIEWDREGWYLFGFIPLYIRDMQNRGRRS